MLKLQLKSKTYLKQILILIALIIWGFPQNILLANPSWRIAEKNFHILFSNKEYKNALYLMLCTLKDIEGANHHKNLLKAAFCCKYIAQSYNMLNENNQSEKYIKESILLFNDAFDQRPHIYTAQAITALGALFQKQGFYQEAIKTYQTAIKTYDLALYKKHIQSTETLYRLAETYSLSNDIVNQEQILKTIQSICEKKSQKSTDLAKIYKTLSTFYKKQNDTYISDIYTKKSLQLKK